MLDEPDPLDYDEYVAQMDSERKKYLEQVALSLRAKVELETAEVYFKQGFRKGYYVGSTITFALTFMCFAVYYVIVKYWS